MGVQSGEKFTQCLHGLQEAHEDALELLEDQLTNLRAELLAAQEKIKQLELDAEDARFASIERDYSRKHGS